LIHRSANDCWIVGVIVIFERIFMDSFDADSEKDSTWFDHQYLDRAGCWCFGQPAGDYHVAVTPSAGYTLTL